MKHWKVKEWMRLKVFIKEVLEVTPFNFNINEEINLDYESFKTTLMVLNELKKLWRKRLKLSVFRRFCLKKRNSMRKKMTKELKTLKSDSRN